jgi:uroporphyrinogen-III synthase
MTDTQQSTLPLAGQRVVITRTSGKADSMALRLRELGAEPIVYPTIAYAPPEDASLLEAALKRLEDGQYDWLILTSAQAVKAVAECKSSIIQQTALSVAAIGPATAKSCVKLLGVQPAAVPEQFIAEGMAAALGDLAGKRVLLPNADIARPVLEERLRATGALVDRVVAYRNVIAPDNGVDMATMLAAGQIGAVTFTSGSTARGFVQKVGPAAPELLGRTVIACIGPATADVCHEIGLVPQVVAAVFTEEGLVDALIAYMEVRR